MRRSTRSQMRFLLSVAAACLLLAGCRSVYAEKHADGSWVADYRSWGLFTDLGRLYIEVGTNGIVRLELNDLVADMSTNHVEIVSASGEFVGEVAGEIVEHLARKGEAD